MARKFPLSLCPPKIQCWANLFANCCSNLYAFRKTARGHVIATMQTLLWKFPPGPPNSTSGKHFDDHAPRFATLRHCVPGVRVNIVPGRRGRVNKSLCFFFAPGFSTLCLGGGEGVLKEVRRLCFLLQYFVLLLSVVRFLFRWGVRRFWVQLAAASVLFDVSLRTIVTIMDHTLRLAA